MVSADLMILTDESSFKQSPETLNSVGVYILSYVFPFFVVYVLVFEALFYFVVPAPFVGYDGRTRFYMLSDEREERPGVGLVPGLRYDPALALEDTHDRHLVFVATALASTYFLIAMSISILAPDVRLIRFYYTAENISVFTHGRPDLHEDAPGSVFVYVYVPSELTGRYALFRVDDESYCVEPLLKWKFCVVKDGPDRDAERFVTRSTVMPVLALNPGDGV